MSWKYNLSNLVLFTLGCLFVIFLQMTVGLYYTNHYFVAHFLFGLIFPFIGCSITGEKWGFRVMWVITLTLHLCHELYLDQLDRSQTIYDWDQVITGLLGLSFSIFAFRWWNGLQDKWFSIKFSPKPNNPNI